MTGTVRDARAIRQACRKHGGTIRWRIDAVVGTLELWSIPPRPLSHARELLLQVLPSDGGCEVYESMTGAPKCSVDDLLADLFGELAVTEALANHERQESGVRPPDGDNGDY